MSRRLDLLMGGVGGGARAGAAAYQGALGRGATEAETPYRRNEWEQMVEERKAALRDRESTLQMREAQKLQMANQEARAKREEERKAKLHQDALDKEARQKQAWQDFAPRLLGEGEDPIAHWDQMGENEALALMAEIRNSKDLQDHPNLPLLEKPLWEILDRIKRGKERDTKLRQASISASSRRSGGGRSPAKTTDPFDKYVALGESLYYLEDEEKRIRAELGNLLEQKKKYKLTSQEETQQKTSESRLKEIPRKRTEYQSERAVLLQQLKKAGRLSEADKSLAERLGAIRSKQSTQ